MLSLPLDMRLNISSSIVYGVTPTMASPPAHLLTACDPDANPNPTPTPIPTPNADISICFDSISALLSRALTQHERGGGKPDNQIKANTRLSSQKTVIQSDPRAGNFKQYNKLEKSVKSASTLINSSLHVRSYIFFSRVIFKKQVLSSGNRRSDGTRRVSEAAVGRRRNSETRTEVEVAVIFLFF